jgi:hypothetical protein
LTECFIAEPAAAAVLLLLLFKNSFIYVSFAAQLHDGMFMPGDMVMHSAAPTGVPSAGNLQSQHHQQQPVVSSSVVGRSSPADRPMPQSASVVAQQQQQPSIATALIDGSQLHFAAVSASGQLQPPAPSAAVAAPLMPGPQQTVMSASVAGMFGHHPEMMETW